MKRSKIAVIQDAPVAFDVPATFEKAQKLVAEAAKNGAELVLFPEAFLCGFPSGLDWGGEATGIRLEAGQKDFLHYWNSAIVEGDEHFVKLSGLARDNEMIVAMGCIERFGSSLYCALLIFDRTGLLVGRRRKLVPTSAERLIWGRSDGSTLKAAKTELGVIGAAICWENFMPLLRASLFAQGVEIYLAPTADDQDVWASSMRHIALEGRCYVLSACQFAQVKDFPQGYGNFPSRDPDFVISNGGSCIVDPPGNFACEPVYGEQAILFAELDPDLIAKGKYLFDVNGHYARPDVFQLSVDMRVAQSVTIET